MNKMLDIMLEPYAEDDALLNSWVEAQLSQIKVNLFRKQTDWLYLNGELGEGCVPKFRLCGRDYIREACYRNLGWLVDYMVNRLVAEYRLSNIDLDEETILDLQWEMGKEEYEEWELECKRRIFKEYCKMMGEDEAKAYFEKLWGEGWDKE